MSSLRSGTRRSRSRRAALLGGFAVTLLGIGLVAATAEAAMTDDPRATAHDGNISRCPAGTTPLLSGSGSSGSNSLVTTTASSGGRFISLVFAPSLTGAGVIAYVKGGPAYNRYVITVGTTDTTLLRSPLLKSGGIPAISHFLICQTGPPPPPPPPLVDEAPSIFLAYADTFHGPLPGQSVPFTPTPWMDDPDVVFVGCRELTTCGKLDSGAIRIDNPATNTAGKTLAAATVTIDGCTFTPWTALLPQTVAPGKQLILTQTGLLGAPMPAPCRNAIAEEFWPFTNFDTSERDGDSRAAAFYNCDGGGGVPVITLTFTDDPALVVNDTAKILNTGGSDASVCGRGNEATPWTGPIPF